MSVATITQPGNLRECADNIFVNRTTGEVDLACTKGEQPAMRMSPTAPLAFSMPNSLKDGNEFVDPRSLCTLFILDRLKVCPSHAHSLLYRTIVIVSCVLL
jgi:hypothetical protein